MRYLYHRHTEKFAKTIVLVSGGGGGIIKRKELVKSPQNLNFDRIQYFAVRKVEIKR